MGAVSGLLSLVNTTGYNSDELANEWQETIFVRNSRGYNVGTTLFGLMSRLDKEPSQNIEFNWFERDPVRKTVYATAANASTNTTTIAIGSSSGAAGDVSALITPGTMLLNDRSKEYMLVTTVAANGDATVVRDAISTTGGGLVASGANAKTVAASDTFTIVTVGRPEGSDPVAAVYETPSTRTNYIQTYNSTVELTNAFKGSVLRSDIDGPLTDRRIQALERIGRDIELSLFLGIRRKQVAATASTYAYFTGGIYDAMVTSGLVTPAASLGTTTLPSDIRNFVDVTTGLGTTTANACTFAGLTSWLGTILPYGSDTKLVFAGPTAFAAISNYANSNNNGYRIMQNENVLGMSITEIQTPFGSIGLTQHPLFREAAGLNTWMVVVDMAHIVQKTFEGLFLEPNIQNNGNDSYKEQYRAKLGVKLRFPQAFGAIAGLRSIV
jgi:hypothetical protein